MYYFSESEYIFRLRKDIVPLRLQPGYRPDGWLGILVGTRLYFDFSKEDLATSNLPRLIKELGNRGKIHAPVARAAAGDLADGRFQCGGWGGGFVWGWWGGSWVAVLFP